MAKIEDILQKGQAASIAFGGGAPYVIPMSYGFEREDGQWTLYLHGACEGEKIRRAKDDPHAAFTVFVDNRVYGEGHTACAYSSTFDSVCGSGIIRFLEGEEKRRGLRAIMAHYAPGKTFAFDECILYRTCVMALHVQSITGKHHD